MPPALPAAPVVHIAPAGQSQGPITMVQLLEAISQGRVTAETLVWMAGIPNWLPAGRVPQLMNSFGPPPIPGS